MNALVQPIIDHLTQYGPRSLSQMYFDVGKTFNVPFEFKGIDLMNAYNEAVATMNGNDTMNDTITRPLGQWITVTMVDGSQFCTPTIDNVKTVVGMKFGECNGKYGCRYKVVNTGYGWHVTKLLN